MTSSAPAVKGQPANAVAAAGASLRQDQKAAKALPEGDNSFQELFDQIDVPIAAGPTPALPVSPDGLSPNPMRTALRMQMPMPGSTDAGLVMATGAPGSDAALVAMVGEMAAPQEVAGGTDTGAVDLGDAAVMMGPPTAVAGIDLAVPALPPPMSADFGKTSPPASDEQSALPAPASALGRPTRVSLDVAPPAEPTTEAAIQFAALRSRPVELQGAAQVAAEQLQSAGKPWTVMRRETHFAPVGVALQNHAAAAQTGDSTNISPVLATSVAPGAGALPPLSPDGAAADTFGAELDAVGVAKATVDHGGREAPLAPVQQIFQRLAGELEEIAGPAPAAPAFSAPGRDAAREPLRSIELALEPAGLGSVTIKLSVRHDGLRVHVDVARSEAMGLINRDKDALTALIQSAGYQIDTVTVRHVDGDRGVTALVASTPDQQLTPRDPAGSSLLQDSSSGGRFEQGQRRSDRGGDDNAAGLARPPVKGVDQGAGRTSAAGIYI